LRGRALLLLSAPLAAALLYLPTLRHEFVFDDHAVIGQNPLLHETRMMPRVLLSPWWNTGSYRGSLYRPLASLSFAADRALAGGLRPAWFHAVNVVLHALATLLVTRLAIRILPGLAGPAVAGLLFAVHPVHVEAVAGVVGRAEILAACGVVGALLCHLGAQAGDRFPLRAVAAWACFAIGLGGKESAVVAPALCLLADAAFPSGAPRRRRWILYAGYGAVLGTYLLARRFVLGSFGVGEPIPFVDNPAAAAGPIQGRLTALGVAARYAGLLLWPRHLSADYSYDQIPVVRTPADPWAIGGLLLVGGVIGAGAWLSRRAPAHGFPLLFTAAAFAPTCNLVFFIGTLMAERLLYLPSAGVCLLAGSLAASLAAAWCSGPLRWAVPAAAALLIGGAAARAAVRVADWRDDFSLYESAARVSPRSTRIRFNLGNAHLRRSAFGPAETHYRAALAIYPGFQDALVNLGMAVLQQGRSGEALELLDRAAARAPGDPDVAVNRGMALLASGDDAGAEAEFLKVIERAPARAGRAWNNLGSMALRRGERERAIERLGRAVSLEPGFAVFRVNLADALAAAGRLAEADAQFREAHRLAPELPEAQRGWGETLLREGRRADAERAFRAAASGVPPSARAANFLGFLLAREGKAAEAAAAYRRAVEIDPSLDDAHKSLGLLYAHHLGDPVRARFHLEASLKLAPDQEGAEDLRGLIAALGRTAEP
jgi:tetratricopeptide (TPR) repeat protein